jgi:hypothetical protein
MPLTNPSGAGTASAGLPPDAATETTQQLVAQRLQTAISGTSVAVSNWPATQPVSGTVSVGNLPATQSVSGTVAVSNHPASISVSNLPATQPVSGSVAVSNLPATQAVSGSVSVGNFPATQPVSGTVGVNNFPASQAVSAAALPLPAGASTETTLAAVNTKLAGTLGVQDAHSRYQASVVAGQVFTGAFQTTVVAANVSPVAAGAAVLAALYNPSASAKKLAILSLTVTTISGTVGGPLVLNYTTGLNSAATATANTTVNNLIGTASPSGRFFGQAAITGSALMVASRVLLPAPAVGGVQREETAGEIVLPAGAVLALAPTAVGTTWVLRVSITWEEI